MKQRIVQIWLAYILTDSEYITWQHPFYLFQSNIPMIHIHLIVHASNWIQKQIRLRDQMANIIANGHLSLFFFLFFYRYTLTNNNFFFSKRSKRILYLESTWTIRIYHWRIFKKGIDIWYKITVLYLLMYNAHSMMNLGGGGRTYSP